MAFYKKIGYSARLAEELLSGATIQLASKYVKPQYDYAVVGKDKSGNDIKKRTDTILAYQIFVVTGTEEPFKVKFLIANKPDLDSFEIGDTVTFEGLEAFENNYGQIYFRATGIKKGK